MATTTTFNKYGREVSVSVEKAIKSQFRKKSGLAYPLSNSTSRIATDTYLKQSRNASYFTKAYGIELIRNNLRQLLQTEKGERVMLPNFGVSLKKYLFEPMDETTFILLKQEVLEAIQNYFPLAQVMKISVLGDDANDHLIKISLTLQLLDSSLDTFEANIEVK
jgi:phage baseplate assembly protein W